MERSTISTLDERRRLPLARVVGENDRAVAYSVSVKGNGTIIATPLSTTPPSEDDIRRIIASGSQRLSIDEFSERWTELVDSGPGTDQ